MIVLKGHDAHCTIWSVAFAPDGTALATAGTDDTVRLWEFGTGQSRVLARPRYPSAITFAADGKTLACAHQEGVSLWQLPPGSNVVLDGFRFSSVWRAAFSPDGRFLAGFPGSGVTLNGRPLAGLPGGSVTLWDVSTGKILRVFPGGRGAAMNLAFAPDGRSLAVSSWIRHFGHAGESVVRLFDPQTGRERASLSGHGHYAGSLAFSPDGRSLAAACGRFLWAWALATGRPVAPVKVDRHHFQQVAFTPDGRFLAAARNDRTVRFWDASTWRLAAAFDWQVGPLVSLAISPDGHLAAAGSKRGKIVVWDVDL